MPAITRPSVLATTATLLTALLLGAAPADAATTTTTTTCGSGSCFLDARTGAHTGYDRLVFDVDGLPTVQSSSVSTSGAYDYNGEKQQNVTIPGKDYLFVNFTGASLYDNTGLSYTTPSPEAVDLPAIKGVEAVNGFEGYVSFAVSLDAYTSYNIFTLTDPDRVVIDVSY